MKTPREPVLPTWLARTLAISVMVIVVLMPLHALLSTWGGTAIGPLWLWKSWKELLLVAVAVMALSWVLFDASARRIIFSDRLTQLVLAFFGLGVVLTVMNFAQIGAAAAGAGFASDLRYLALAFVTFILFRFTKWSWPDISKKSLVYLTATGLALGFIGILQVTVIPPDFLANFGYDKDTTIAPFMTIDENPDALRAFATLRGPNDYGAFLILPLLASLLLLKRLAWKIPAVIVITSGLLLSVSRSAWIGAVLAVIALLALTYGHGFLRSKQFIYSGAIGILAVVILIFSAMSVPALRLAIFRSSPGDTSLTEGSTDQHWLAAAGGLERIATNPFGCGVGCAGPASYYGDEGVISENYYIQITEEVGVVGLALWLVIAGLIAKRLYDARDDLLARVLLASFVGLSAIGLWLHVWADDPLSLTWWGLTGAVLGYSASVTLKKTVR